MNPRIEIDEIYKEMMAQKEQNVLCDDLLNRIDWIKKIKPDIRQAEITKLSVILIKELQRFSNWEEIKSDAVFIEELSNIIDMIATTEYSIGNNTEGTEAPMGATVPDYRIENQPQSNVNIEEGVDDNGNNKENTSTNFSITGQMGFH